MQEEVGLQQSLVKQVQFYLSEANILTDVNIQKQISKNSSWITVAYLLRCGKVKQIFTKMQISNKRRAKKLSKILSQSGSFKVCNNRVKRRHRINLKSSSNKTIYLESKRQQIEQVHQKLQEIKQKNKLQISIKSGQQWILIAPSYKQLQFDQIITQQLAHFPNLKVLRGQEWDQEQTKFDKLVKTIKQQRKQHQLKQKDQILQ